MKRSISFKRRNRPVIERISIHLKKENGDYLVSETLRVCPICRPLPPAFHARYQKQEP